MRKTIMTALVAAVLATAAGIGPAHADGLAPGGGGGGGGSIGTGGTYVNGMTQCTGIDNTGATDTATNAQTCITNNAGNTIYFPAGTYKINARLSVPNGTAIVGAGMMATVFKVPSATASAFYFNAGYGTPGSRSSIGYMGFNTQTNAVPVAGSMIETNVSEVWMTDLWMGRCFDCIKINGTTMMKNLRLYAYYNAALHVLATTLCNLSDFIFVGSDEYAAAPGILTVGTGFLIDTTWNGVNGTLLQNVKAEHGDVIYGQYGLKVTGPSGAWTPQGAPAFSFFTDVLFDSMNGNPGWMDYSIGFTFQACWFVNSATSHGFFTDHIKDTRFIDTYFLSNNGYGLIFGAGGKGTRVIGSTASHNVNDGIHVGANGSDFIIRDCVFGAALYAGTWLHQSQPNGIVIDTGTSDRYIVQGNLKNGNNITDNGGGVNKLVANNY